MSYLYQRRVAFSDTDAAGRVHFSRVLCYVEEAEHLLMAELQIPLLEDGGWPRVHVDCNYFSPLFPGDEVEVILIPSDIGVSSIIWSFSILCKGRDVAKGTIKTVRVNASGKPEEIKSQWKEALQTV